MRDCHLCVKRVCFNSPRSSLSRSQASPPFSVWSFMGYENGEERPGSFIMWRMSIYTYLSRQRWEGSRQAWDLSGSVGTEKLASHCSGQGDHRMKCIPSAEVSLGLLVSQATPFAERGRVWSCCTWQIVTKKCNYQIAPLDNKILTSAKHVTIDTIYEECGSHWSQQVSVLVTTRLLQCDQTLPISAKGVACKAMIRSDL